MSGGGSGGFGPWPGAAASGGTAPSTTYTPGTSTNWPSGSVPTTVQEALDLLRAIRYFNVTVPGGGTIPAHSGVSLTVTVTGLKAADMVLPNLRSAVFSVGAGVSCSTFASAANQLTLVLYNCTGAAVSIPSNFPLHLLAFSNPGP